ncbi:MAG: glycosyltransferase [Chitinophagales bacterium]
MRIIHVIPSLAIGGAEKLCIDLCNTLSDQGHDVLLVRLSPTQEFDEKNFRFSTLVLNEKARLRFMRGMVDVPNEWKALVEEFSPDIIHSHLFEAEVFSKSILLPKTAYFTHCHDNMHQFKRGINVFRLLNKEEFTRLYERYFLLKTYKSLGQNHFVCISENNQKYFQRNLPNNFRITKLSNAIPLKTFQQNQRRPDGQEGLGLVSVGSLTPLKNHAYLFKVLQEIDKQNVSVTLDLIGGGPLFSELQNMAQNLAIDEAISLQGKQTNVSAFYQKNTLYIHSATSEGFGLTQVEAMAAGLPVIALDAGGNRDIVQNGINGYLLPQGTSPQIFAKKILSVWHDKDLLALLRQGAIKTAAEFDIKPYCNRLLTLYKNALN